MRSQRVYTLFAVVLVALLLITACTPTPTAAPAQPTAVPATAVPVQPTAVPATAAAQPTAAAGQPAVYKIGFINHLTGDAAVYGQSAKKGVDLAVDQINKAGGIGGVPIELVVEDDRLDAATAQTAFLKVTQTDKVPVVIGPASSGISLSLCKKLPEWNVVDVSISSAAAVRDCGANFFSVFPNDVAQGPEWVKIAQKLGATEVALMYINNDYGNGVKDEFTKAFTAAGGKLLISQPFELGGKDFRTEVLKVKQTNPKFVFIVDHTAEGSVVLQQANELGLTTQWVLDVSMQSPELLQLAGAGAEGAIALRAGSALTPEFKQFTDAFKAKYGEDPTIWSDFSYDQMMLVAKAIEKGGYTTEGIKTALMDVSKTYTGPSGQKAFDQFHVSQGVYDWMIAKNGKWEVYQAAGNASTAAAQPTAAAGQPAVYKIGFINHLTGDAAVYGQSAKKGVDLAVDQINKAGGIGGVPIELVVEDDRLDAATAQTAFLKVTQTDKVPVVIGPASSGISLSLCKKLPEWNVVDVSISSAAAVRDCGANFFSVFPNDVAQGPEWVKIAQKLGATEVALMYINNDYGNGVKDEFTKAFTAAGGKLLISQPFELGGKDFRTEVLKVKQTNPKFVFIVDHTAEGSVVLQQANELGLTTQWVLDVSMQSPELLQLAGAGAEGAIALRAGSALTPEFKQFTDAFKAKYGEDPTIWSDFSYDQMMLVAKAIEKGGYTTEGIKTALMDVSKTYTGPSGQKAFDQFHVSQGVYDWMIAKNGKWEVYQAAGKP